jgi:hypothetical protein
MNDDMPVEGYANTGEEGADWEDVGLADRDGGDELIGVVVVNWRDAGEEETAEALHELSAWVTWLVARYNVDTRKIPDCWIDHTDLIEELSALHTAWQVAFDQTDGGYGPVGWHERLAAAFGRSAFKDRCSISHRDDSKRTLS